MEAGPLTVRRRAISACTAQSGNFFGPAETPQRRGRLLKRRKIGGFGIHVGIDRPGAPTAFRAIVAVLDAPSQNLIHLSDEPAAICALRDSCESVLPAIAG